MRWLALVVALSTRCRRGSTESPAQLLSAVKEGLVERGGKVSSYRLAGKTEERGQTAAFSFEYRAPNKMRAELLSPNRVTYAFDGAVLYTSIQGRAPSALPLQPGDEGALLLARTFGPFAPEGYRCPLLSKQGVSAKRTTDLPQAPEAVSVTQEIPELARSSVTYVLRWPALDFLEKRLETSGKISTDRVESEHCAPSVGRCFPRRIVHLEGTEVAGVTSFTTIEINPELAAERFVLPGATGAGP